MTEENEKLLKMGGRILCSSLGVLGLLGLTLAGLGLAGMSAFGAMLSSSDAFFSFIFLIGIAIATLGFLKLVHCFFDLGRSSDKVD